MIRGIESDARGSGSGNGLTYENTDKDGYSRSMMH
jgi:hypothetical protein